MTAYGMFVISMVDNIVKPIILKGSAQIHMMLGFLSILGGLLAFGPKGLIVGPVVLSLVLSAYRIYRYDILRWREEEGMGATIMAGLPPPGTPSPSPSARRRPPRSRRGLDRRLALTCSVLSAAHRSPSRAKACPRARGRDSLSDRCQAKRALTGRLPRNKGAEASRARCGIRPRTWESARAWPSPSCCASGSGTGWTRSTGPSRVTSSSGRWSGWWRRSCTSGRCIGR